MQRSDQTGFALVDMLIALLLLATGLLGACAALIQTLRATQDALFTTRAVDRVTDLDEQLQSVTSVTGRQLLINTWRTQTSDVLPVAGMGKEQVVSWSAASTTHDATYLTLRWRSTSDRATQELRLPLAVALDPAP